MKLITEPTPTTLQGVFDRAWAWANRPDFKRCTGESSNLPDCLYRSEDGTNACLIGCCIPDSKYKSSIEGFKPGQLPFFPGLDVNAMSDLQYCHDGARNNEDVITRLKKFAEEHNLTITL